MLRVCLDSCIVIYLFQAPAATRDVVRRALVGDSKAPTPYVSALTRLECRVWPLRQMATDLLAAFDHFFGSRGLRVVRFTRAVFDLATELRAEYGIKTPDALHLAAALKGSCDEFWANDRRLPRALEARVSVRILP